MNDNSLEKIIYEETEKRLSIMEKKDYVFPSKMGRVDSIGIVVCVGISILLIVLCMMGVIE